MAEENRGLKRQVTTLAVVEGLKQARISKTAQEEDVGITVFLNEARGAFYGTIKQRYSDFLVNEIDTKGNVVHLLDEGINLGKSKKEKKAEQRRQERAELQNKTPEEIEQIKKEKEAKQLELISDAPKYTLSEENKLKLLQLINEEELKEIENLFTNGGKYNTTSKFEDKKSRTELHHLFRESFQNKLDTLTMGDSTIGITLRTEKSRNNVRGPRPTDDIIGENGEINYGLGPYKNYLHFTVYKENRETMEVANTLVRFLRIPPKSIRYAGTKDRRGITCQRFSIEKAVVQRVTSLNKGLRGSILGGFAYENEPLTLGALNGNKFMITVRDLKTTDSSANVDEVVTKAFESLETKGFINYYGMQRFGSFSIPTHHIGIQLLKGDWQQAAETLLSDQEIVVPESVEARKKWASTRDAKQARLLMPKQCVAESCLLKAFEKETQIEDEDGTKRYNKDVYFKAIQSIPRNLRMMYVHAYQSYVWNVIASKRIELFGLKPVVGDLVIMSKEETKIKSEDGFEEDVAEDNFIRARPLTSEDIESGKYSIYDIVLPQPGFDIKYPDIKEIEQEYVRVMEQDGLNPHLMERKVRDFSLAGSYRNVISRASNVSHRIVKYTNDTDPLVRSDLELLHLKKERETNGEEYDESKERFIDPVLEEGKEVKTAVTFSIDLETSSYATMLMRELMNIETSRFGESMFK